MAYSIMMWHAYGLQCRLKDPNGYYMRNGKLGQLTNGSRSITSNNNVYLQGQLVFIL